MCSFGLFVGCSVVTCISLSLYQHSSCTPAQVVRTPADAVTSALTQVFRKRVIQSIESQHSTSVVSVFVFRFDGVWPACTAPCMDGILDWWWRRGLVGEGELVVVWLLVVWFLFCGCCCPVLVWLLLSPAQPTLCLTTKSTRRRVSDPVLTAARVPQRKETWTRAG